MTVDTRGAAAEAIGPHLDRLQQAVLGFIRGRGDRGATDQEVAAGLELQADTTRARRVELRDAGLVCDSGRRRPTSTGRAATVWIAVGPQRQRTLDELTASVASPGGRFAGWVRRADVRGRWGWEAPGLPDRICWWRWADWESLPSPPADPSDK